jgi:hypothetical protein
MGWGVGGPSGVGPGLAAGIGGTIGGMRRGLAPGASTGLPLKSPMTSGTIRSNGKEPAQAEPLRQSRKARLSPRIFALEQKTRMDGNESFDWLVFISIWLSVFRLER